MHVYSKIPHEKKGKKQKNNQTIDSQTNCLTKFAKNMTTKAPKYHNGKPKFEGRWYLLVGGERKYKK